MVDKRKSPRKFDEEFKKSIVKLYEGGKSQNALANEYGIALSSVARWVKQYSEVKIDDDTILTARQIKQLQKRNLQLEEENLILKKAIAIFTPHSTRVYYTLEKFYYYILSSFTRVNGRCISNGPIE